MTDEEVKAEARRRIEGMSKEEKRKICGFTEEEDNFLDYVEKVGKSNLTPEQEKKFYAIIRRNTQRGIPGGFKQGAIEAEIKSEFNITRDEIKNMKKNPYKSKVFLTILISFITSIGAIGLAYGGYGAAALGLESTSGVFALAFANQLKKYFRFKKIQKQYATGEMDEKLISAEINNQIYAERAQRWRR